MSNPLHIREKTFHEMKKDVGMTTAQKCKEIRRMEIGSIFVLYIQPIPTYTLIVGWIYRTKIDPISILLVSLLFEQWSSLHLFSFYEMFFPLGLSSSLLWFWLCIEFILLCVCRDR